MSVQPRHSAILVRLRCLALAMLALVSTSTAQEKPRDDQPLRFLVEADSSWLRVLVYRGGLLRGFGHNHVISHDEISGFLLVGGDPLRSEVHLEFDVAGLMVDEPQQRALAGGDFPGRIPEKDIAATRSNMLGARLLQAEQYPTIRIHSETITGSMPELRVEATILIRGREFNVVFPAHVELDGDSLLASGEAAIRHADLGLKPFTAALGSLRVRDSLLLQYHIAGRRPVTDGANQP